jgi:fatty acid desaturase
MTPPFWFWPKIVLPSLSKKQNKMSVRVLYSSKGYFCWTSVSNDDDNDDDDGKKATVTTHRWPKWWRKWYQHKTTSLGWLLSEPQGQILGIGEANNKKRQQQQQEKMMISRTTCRLYTTIDITTVVLITIDYPIITCAIFLSLWCCCHYDCCVVAAVDCPWSRCFHGVDSLDSVKTHDQNATLVLTEVKTPFWHKVILLSIRPAKCQNQNQNGWVE